MVTAPVLPPRLEGTVELGTGRRIGYAEYGPADGDPMLWFHGTPGARRQVPPAARVLAAERGVRILALERPGVGASTPHLHGTLVEWAHDVEEVADRLGLDRFGAIGLSGGGPYVLACAHELPDRVVAGAVLGGVAPTRGPDAVSDGPVGWATRLAPLVEVSRVPLGYAAWWTVRLARPLASPVFDLYMRFQPEGDRRFFARPEIKSMFLDDIVSGARHNMQAVVHDLVLFTRPWGFSPRDIRVPIHFWHGDTDHMVPLAHGQHLAALVPGATLTVRPGESHLGGLDAAEEVVERILGHWSDRPHRPRPRAVGPATRGARTERPPSA